MKPAVVYIRVSTKEQQEAGYSPEAQKRLLWAFARENGFTVDETCEDSETAGKSGRKNFEKMLDFIKQEGIKNIIAEKTDRLYRNFKDYGILDDLAASSDINVYLVKEGVVINKNNNSHEKFIHGIKTLMAKNFIDNLREEVNKGMNEKVESGEYPGKAPIGYLNHRDAESNKSKVVIDERNRALAVRLYELYATGRHSIKSVAAAVRKEGLTINLPVGFLFSTNAVYRLLQNPFYYGYFRWKGQLHKGAHQPLISFELWKKVQNVFSQKTGKEEVSKSRKNNTIPFLYKDFFTCGKCGRSVTAEKKKGKYVYYHCTRFGTNCKQPNTREEAISEAVSGLLGGLQYDDTLIQYVTEGLKRSLADKRSVHDAAYERLVAEKSMLQQRNDRLYEDKLDGKIAEDRYGELFDKYSNRILELDEQISHYDRVEIDYFDFGRRILELAKSSKNLYEMATDGEKQEILGFLLSNSKLTDAKPVFALKQPFSTIEKHSLVGSVSHGSPKGNRTPICSVKGSRPNR